MDNKTRYAKRTAHDQDMIDAMRADARRKMNELYGDEEARKEPSKAAVRVGVAIIGLYVGVIAVAALACVGAVALCK